MEHEELSICKLKDLLEDTDSETVLLVLNMVLDDLPNHVSEIQKLIIEKNNHEISRRIHSLKSSIGSLGATRFYYLADNLENRLKKDSLQECSELLGSFLNEIKNFQNNTSKEIHKHLEHK